jgi:eukaryotic-like serine/threonine-protein kinase
MQQLPATIGRFQIREQLGQGAFGTVYRAFDPQFGREVALKVPHPGTLANPKACERFLREALAAGRLQHPNIVPIFEVSQDGQAPYIVSAYIKGKNLAESLAEERLDCRRAVVIVHALAEALACAHKARIIHRDVKPANVMLDERGQVYLMDFGVAHLADATRKLTQTGLPLGTPAYIPPEQAAGGPPRPAGDQYSLGALFYELLCGQTPFAGPPALVLFNVVHQEPPPLHTLNSAIPPELEVICQKAMAKQPEHRYASCQEFADELARWLNGQVTLTPVPGFYQRAWTWCRQHVPLVITGSGAAIFLITTIVLAIQLGNRNESVGKDKDPAFPATPPYM